MKLPDRFQIIGLCVYDDERGEAEIFWDDWWVSQNEDICGADALQDIAGLAKIKYEQHLNRLEHRRKKDAQGTKD